MFRKAIKFLREVYVELTKVSWSSRKEVIGSTMIVLLLVIILAVFIGLVDFALSRLLGLLIR